jgi:hypothetical protein
MSGVTVLVALALLAIGLSVRLIRRLHASEEAVASLSESMRELSARLDAAEQDAATALVRADVAESVLVEKGLADEEDLEAARARSGTPEPPGYIRGRDGDLH